MDEALYDIIRRHAESERQSVIENAEAEAAAIINAAQKRAETAMHEAREAIKNDADRLRQQRLNTERYRMNVKRYDAKAQAIDTVWRVAESKVRELIQSPEFDTVLCQLILECSGDVPSDASLHLPESHTERVLAFLKAQKLSFEVVGDKMLTDGVEFHWPGSKVVLKNTLSQRLSRLKSDSGDTVSAMLFGDTGESDR